MDGTVKTRDIFLSGMAVTYLFAFGSLFPQISGLFGRKGIVPIAAKIQEQLMHANTQTAEKLYLDNPTFVHFMPFEPELSMEIFCLLGTALSMCCLMFQQLRNCVLFGVLFLLYLSLFKVGPTFLHFQWDTLLLEAGFISCLVARLSNRNQSSAKSMCRQIPWFLVKWLLFRLMFASGVVKLTSGCPTWWQLTALNYHYQSQCLPTPLAWWAHQFPVEVHRLSVVGTYLIEIGCPLLFFSPLRMLRIAACYAQIFLMFLITLTGNYNFFNFLTVVLCLSLLDDRHLDFVKRKLSFRKTIRNGLKSNNFSSKIVALLNVLSGCGIAYICQRVVNFGNPVSLNFDQEDLNGFLRRAVPAVIWVAALGFLATVVRVCFSYTFDRRLSWTAKVSGLSRTCFILPLCIFTFSISLVPFITVYQGVGRVRLWPTVDRWHRAVDHFELTHSYGLFRRMTGVGGRPELVIERSHAEDGPWQEYDFRYKPGNLSNRLPWAVPHQPRLDWQLWFAALGSYQHNPWFVSLLHRVLINQPDVLALVNDQPTAPKRLAAPTYVRALLYHYSYTNLTAASGRGWPKKWWKRTLRKTYLPALSKDSDEMLKFLKYHNLMPLGKSKNDFSSGKIHELVKRVKQLTAHFPIPLLLWSLLTSALAIRWCGESDLFLAHK